MIKKMDDEKQKAVIIAKCKYKKGDIVYHKLDNRKLIISGILFAWNNDSGNSFSSYLCNYIENGSYMWNNFREHELINERS